MQRIFIDNHDRILCYGNPAGYITGKEAVVDTMFQTQELESFLQKQALTIAGRTVSMTVSCWGSAAAASTQRLRP